MGYLVITRTDYIGQRLFLSNSRVPYIVYVACLFISLFLYFLFTFILGLFFKILKLFEVNTKFT